MINNVEKLDGKGNLNGTMVGNILYVDYGEDDFSPYMGTLQGKWYMVGVEFDDKSRGSILLMLDREAFDKVLDSGEFCRMGQLLGKRLEFNADEKRYRVIK